MIVAVAMAVLSGLSGQVTVLTGYESAVRCAGLTQAASELEGGESARGQRLFDAALYWSLAAGQAADAAGRPAEISDNDQTRARIRAVRELNAGEDAAREALSRCLERTPDLG
ncbi:MAG: hypothetical protein ACK4FB_03670 [Brevundimonas sp.]|uniref:hypothetical protein n=1 Tax=Brevundimonas sp. TaxID=1871086 RepID=UPI00391B4444